jgi:tol-pal system protein YbgF
VGDVIAKQSRTAANLTAASVARALMIAVAVIAGDGVAMAQTPDAAKPVAKAAAKAAAVTAAAPTPGEGGLKSRVESLEEQLVDMQVVVGTLESLAKTGGAGPSPVMRTSAASGASGGAPSGADAGRVEALETQVRSLSSQMQQLNDQLRNQGGALPRRSESTGAAPPAQANAAPAFGSTTVTPGGDAIGGLIDGAQIPAGTPSTGALGATPAPVATAALAPAGDGSDPKQLYETAHGYLLQRDYGAAEVAFDDFLKKFPSDSLAGSAQYWLGETYFVRGQYKAAAGAFLKGYQSYGQGTKAPDSLLKLAMSLDRLGQKDAACSSFGELNVKFPSAPQSVKARAQAERQRVGCP